MCLLSSGMQIHFSISRFEINIVFLILEKLRFGIEKIAGEHDMKRNIIIYQTVQISKRPTSDFTLYKA